MFMSGIIVNDRMDMFACRYGRLDRIEEADVFLVPVFLHALADNFAIQHVKGGEQGGGAMPLIVVRHRAAAPLL